jgi:hypothetical protein
MGHERVGMLPKSARWTRLVHQMGRVSASEVPVGSPAAQTLQNVRKRYETLFQDDAVKSAGPVAGPRSAILTPTLCVPPTDRRGEGDRRMRGRGVVSLVSRHRISGCPPRFTAGGGKRRTCGKPLKTKGRNACSGPSKW